jgi:hypothetical protein
MWVFVVRAGIESPPSALWSGCESGLTAVVALIKPALDTSQALAVRTIAVLEDLAAQIAALQPEPDAIELLKLGRDVWAVCE